MCCLFGVPFYTSGGGGTVGIQLHSHLLSLSDIQFAYASKRGGTTGGTNNFQI